MIAVIGAAFFFRNEIRNVLTYGLGDWPTHGAFESCNWKKRTFSKIALFEQDCSDSSLQSPLFENGDGKVVQTQPSEYGYSFKLQLFTRTIG